MTEDLWLIFYVTYGIAALLLLVILVRGLVKGYAGKRIIKELRRPLPLIIGSLVLWYATIYIAGDIGSRF